MTDFKYANPRHDCPALGKNTIIPKVARSQSDGSIKLWGFKCPFCSKGREFTPQELQDYKDELDVEASEVVQ